MYIKKLLPIFDDLQSRYGSTEHDVIYGAGEIHSPELMLVFMNPTARNVSASKIWNGLKAPWIGTKAIWKMFHDLGLLDDNEIISATQQMKPSEWDEGFSSKLYKHVAKKSLYVTNIAKCTQVDARHLSNNVLREYLPSFFEEISIIKPKKIITFGNQVSSVLLESSVSVSKYPSNDYELITIKGKKYEVYPCYYPVGQGRRNMALAKDRIRKVLAQQDE